jgi:putative hydrolase of the HAD superfamily
VNRSDPATPQPGRIRAVFFDAVGTLLHPEPSAASAYAAAARRFGSRLDRGAIAARFVAAFARQERADFAAGLRTDEGREAARWRAIVGEVLDDVSDPETCFEELYTHFARPAAWRCAEGAPVLGELAGRGYALGIASNFDHRLRGVVAGLPTLRPVRHLVISSEVGWRKPAAEFFRAVCARVGLPPGQVLHVGDDPVNDAQGARAAGMQSLLVAPGRPSPCPDTAVLAALADLPAWLRPGPG